MLTGSHDVDIICCDLFELMEKHTGMIDKDILGQYEDRYKKGLKEVNLALRYLVNLKLFNYTDDSEYRIVLTPEGWEALKVGLVNYMEQQKKIQNQQVNNQTSITNITTIESKSFWKSVPGIIILGSTSSILAYYIIEYFLKCYKN